MDEPLQNGAASDARVVLAGELALGLTRRSELGAAHSDDPDFRREVERWEEDLAKLVDELAPVPPPPRVWTALTTAMGQADVPSGARVPWMESLTLWRGLAATSTAAALALAAMLAGTSPVKQLAPPQTQALLVAALTPKEGPPLFTATYDPERRSIIIIPAAFESEPGRIAQLWIVPKDADEPIAIGRIEPSRPSAIAVPPAEAQRIDEATGIAVTSEPLGATDVSAAGPLIAHGRFALVQR